MGEVHSYGPVGPDPGGHARSSAVIQGRGHSSCSARPPEGLHSASILISVSFPCLFSA